MAKSSAYTQKGDGYMASTKAIERCISVHTHACWVKMLFPLCGIFFEMTAACGHFRHAFTSLSDTKALTPYS